MRIVIIEDEPRAVKRLKKLILDCEPTAQIVKILESVKESLAYFKTKPEIDLIFSDIQLADSLSFDIYAQTEINAPIIFTTAYDQYAIEAFKTNGIDYLLKPIKEEEIQKAIDKFKALTRQKVNPDLKAIAEMLKNSSPKNVNYKQRFMVKVGTHIKSIDTDNALAFYSKDKATFIYTNEKRSYVLEQSLDVLEEDLDPEHFYRINRGYIINRNGAKDILTYSNSRLKIEIEGLEDEIIIVARDRTKGFKTWLGE